MISSFACAPLQTQQRKGAPIGLNQYGIDFSISAIVLLDELVNMHDVFERG